LAKELPDLQREAVSFSKLRRPATSLSTFKQPLELYDANIFPGLHASITTSFQSVAVLNERAWLMRA